MEARYQVNTFLKERIGETLTGFTASVVIDVFSPDLDVLAAKGRQIAAILKEIPMALSMRRAVSSL
jgi:Cu/Ag efflux pump CusA